MHKFFIAAVAVLAASCGTFQYGVKAVAYHPANEAALKGKTLAIQPVEVSFGGMRANLDLRGAVKVNGRDLFGTYLAQDKSAGLGTFGVMDTNILKLAKTDKQAVSDAVTADLRAYLTGARDFRVSFFNGLGEGNYGELSNRSLQVVSPDRPSPLKPVGDPLPPYFLSVAAGGPADLTLSSQLELTSEVVEILTAPDPAPGATLDQMDSLPKAGQYWLRINAYVSFQLKDAQGQLVASDRDKFGYTVKDVVQAQYKIPVAKGDGEGFYKYFRTQDLLPYAQAAVAGFLESMAPRLAPFYVNTLTMTEVKAK